MATLASQSIIAIGAASTTAASTTLLVLPVAGADTGTGRLIHPTLGTYDYDEAPDEWHNLRGDIIVPPIWASSQTLSGAANTFWPGSIKDVIVEEVWTARGGLAMNTAQLQQLINFFTTPPDPASDFVQWWPSYDSVLGFDVVILRVGVGGSGISINDTIRATASNGKNYVEGPVTLQMRIIARQP